MAEWLGDKSGANTAAVRGLIADSGVTIELRQSKYLNNLVEQDHRSVQAANPANDGIQDLSLCGPRDRRHRDHAHGQEGAAALPRWPGIFRCRLLLQPRRSLTRTT